MFVLITGCYIFVCYLLGLAMWLSKGEVLSAILPIIYLLCGFAWVSMVPVTLSMLSIAFIICVGILSGILTGVIISFLKK